MSLAEAVFDALGDPTRRQVFQRLRRAPRSVRELADGLHVSRPAVSQHLRVLKDAQLVTGRAEGTRRVYAVDLRGLEAARQWLDGMWDEVLDRFKQAAEAAHAAPLTPGSPGTPPLSPRPARMPQESDE